MRRATVRRFVISAMLVLFYASPGCLGGPVELEVLIRNLLPEEFNITTVLLDVDGHALFNATTTVKASSNVTIGHVKAPQGKVEALAIAGNLTDRGFRRVNEDSSYWLTSLYQEQWQGGQRRIQTGINAS